MEKKAFEITVITQDSKLGSLNDLAQMLLESGVLKAFYSLRANAAVFEVETPIDQVLAQSDRTIDITVFSTLQLQAEIDRREGAQGLDPIKLHHSQALIQKRAALALVK